MALVQLSVTKKNSLDYVYTELFNTARIPDFYAKDATTVIFYYKEIGDKRERTDKYETTLTLAQFEAKFDEILYDERVALPILEIYSPSKEVVTRTINVAVADVIKAKNIDATTCYLWFARGQFESIKVKVDATIAEIESASSTSVSIV